MCETNFIYGWASLMESLAMAVIILIALSLMLGLVKPADALKYGGVIVGIAIIFMLIPIVLANLWSGMSLWQQVALIAIGICLWRWRQERQRPRKKKEED